MKAGWMYAVQRLFLRPRQVIITDTHNHGPARKFDLRPVTALFAAAGLAALLLFAGMRLAGAPESPRQQNTIQQLQNDLARFRDKATEQEALLVLRDQEVASLKQEIDRLREEQSGLRQRLDMYEAILAARKRQGVHLLQASAHHAGDQSIAYSFVLVKGGNYPRTASGSIRFSTLTPANEELLLKLANGEDALRYRTQSHTFLQGSLPWNEPWQPAHLRITVLDRGGKQIEFHEVPIRHGSGHPSGG